MRHQAALADAATLSAQGADDDLDSLVAWTADNSTFEN